MSAATDLLSSMELNAADPTISASERKVRQHLVAQWEARLVAEAKRAAETNVQLRGLREQVSWLERDVSNLVSKLRRWKRWFSAAILARRTLDALREFPGLTVTDALPMAERAARAELDGRIDLDDGT